MIDSSHIQRLTEIEAQVHYGELPPPGCNPFVAVLRNSPVVLSAPHGSRTFRNNSKEIWHEEDEYTAGMALLLSEICQTSVIATIWRTEESDPNEHGEERSAYKRVLRHLVETSNPRPHYLIDLHGAGQDSPFMAETQKVDLGTGRQRDYLTGDVNRVLTAILEKQLGKGALERDGNSGFDANQEHRIAAFAHNSLGLASVQIEMKPSVRVACRRIDSSMYSKTKSKFSGPYSATSNEVMAMMQSLVDFIEVIKAE